MRGLAFIALLALAPGAAAQTPADARGKRLYLQCQACHSMAAGQAHKVGPNLHGFWGAKAASRPGYAYSTALKNSGLVWNEATLDPWLTRSSAQVPGTKMVYAGMPRAEDRAALIAYLKRASR